MELPKSQMKDILKRKGAERVSEDAMKKLGELLELYAGDVSEEAIAKAEKDGRKTVRRKDVLEASR